MFEIEGLGPTPKPADVVEKYRALAEQNQAAVDEVARRLNDAGRHKTVATYQELGQGLRIRVDDQVIDCATRSGAVGRDARVMLDKIVGFLTALAYQEQQVVPAAFVVLRRGEPTEAFFELARQLGRYVPRGAEEAKLFWAKELEKAYKVAWLQSPSPRVSGSTSRKATGSSSEQIFVVNRRP